MVVGKPESAHLGPKSPQDPHDHKKPGKDAHDKAPDQHSKIHKEANKSHDKLAGEANEVKSATKKTTEIAKKPSEAHAKPAEVKKPSEAKKDNGWGFPDVGKAWNGLVKENQEKLNNVQKSLAKGVETFVHKPIKDATDHLQREANKLGKNLAPALEQAQKVTKEIESKAKRYLPETSILPTSKQDWNRIVKNGQEDLKSIGKSLAKDVRSFERTSNNQVKETLGNLGKEVHKIGDEFKANLAKTSDGFKQITNAVDENLNKYLPDATFAVDKAVTDSSKWVSEQAKAVQNNLKALVKDNPGFVASVAQSGQDLAGNIDQGAQQIAQTVSETKVQTDKAVENFIPEVNKTIDATEALIEKASDDAVKAAEQALKDFNKEYQERSKQIADGVEDIFAERSVTKVRSEITFDPNQRMTMPDGREGTASDFGYTKSPAVVTYGRIADSLSHIDGEGKKVVSGGVLSLYVGRHNLPPNADLSAITEAKFREAYPNLPDAFYKQVTTSTGDKALADARSNKHMKKDLADIASGKDFALAYLVLTPEQIEEIEKASTPGNESGAVPGNNETGHVPDSTMKGGQPDTSKFSVSGVSADKMVNLRFERAVVGSLIGTKEVLPTVVLIKKGSESAPNQPKSDKGTSESNDQCDDNGGEHRHRGADAKTPDAKTPDAKTPDAKTPDAKTPDAKTPDAKTPDAKTPDAKTPESTTPSSGANPSNSDNSSEVNDNPNANGSSHTGDTRITKTVYRSTTSDLDGIVEILPVKEEKKTKCPDGKHKEEGDDKTDQGNPDTKPGKPDGGTQPDGTTPKPDGSTDDGKGPGTPATPGGAVTPGTPGDTGKPDGSDGNHPRDTSGQHGDGHCEPGAGHGGSGHGDGQGGRGGWHNGHGDTGSGGSHDRIPTGSSPYNGGSSDTWSSKPTYSGSHTPATSSQAPAYGSRETATSSQPYRTTNSYQRESNNTTVYVSGQPRSYGSVPVSPELNANNALQAKIAAAQASMYAKQAASSMQQLMAGLPHQKEGAFANSLMPGGYGQDRSRSGYDRTASSAREFLHGLEQHAFRGRQGAQPDSSEAAARFLLSLRDSGSLKGNQVPGLARTAFGDAQPLKIDPLTGKPLGHLPGLNPFAQNPLTQIPLAHGPLGNPLASNPLANPLANPFGKPLDIGKFDPGAKIPGLGAKFDIVQDIASGFKAWQGLNSHMPDGAGHGQDWRGMRPGLPGANEGTFGINASGAKFLGINFDFGGPAGMGGGKGNLIPDASAIGKGFDSFVDGIIKGTSGQNIDGVASKNPLGGLGADLIGDAKNGLGGSNIFGIGQGGLVGDADASIQMGMLGLNDKGEKIRLDGKDGAETPDGISQGTKGGARLGPTDKGKKDGGKDTDKSTVSEDKDKKEAGLRKRYVIKDGDTLDSIAIKELGDKRFASLILTINRRSLTVTGTGKSQVVLLTPAQVIWLPAKSDLDLHRKFFFGGQKVVDNSPS